MVSKTARDSTDLVAAGLVQQLRHDLGLTQRQVAERARLPQSVVSEYETGRRQPSLGALIRLVEACGMELRLRLDDRDRHDELLAVAYPAETLAAFAAEQAAILNRRTVARLTDKHLRDVLPPALT